MSVPTPDLLSGFPDSDWSYYVPGHDAESVREIGEPDSLEWQALWMRPVKASMLRDELDDGETVMRDESGKFAPRWCWLECPATDSEARAFLGVRHRA